MRDFIAFVPYLLVCAGVTYLIRMIPLVLFKKQIKNRFICSFLYYIPYAVLAAMTVPAIFYATSSVISAVCGFLVAFLLAWRERGLLTVATAACVAVLACEWVMTLLP